MNVPKLRFSEFNDEWHVCKFSDFTKINQGLQIEIKDRFLEPGENRYFYITNQFLKENSFEKYYIESPNQSVICDKDDILMTRTGNTGKVLTNIEGCFHNNFFKIKYDKSIADKNFLFYNLTSDKLQRKILSYAGTSTIPDLNHSDFYRLKCGMPSLEEQEKIGNMLSLLDKKIELQSKKIEDLKLYKKGLLNDLFCKKFENTKKLKEINITISDGNYGELYPKSDELTDNGEVPFIRVNNLQDLGLTFENMKYITKSKHSILLSGHLKENDILITTRGDIGKVAIVDKRFIDANINAQLALLRLDEKSEIIPYYLLEYLNYNYNYIQTFITGSALKQLPIKNLLKLQVSYPSIDKQIKYSNMFFKLNNKLYIEKKKLNKLNELKKGLMQNMFI